MWSCLPYFIYLLAQWYFTGIMRPPLALAGAVGSWGLCAWLLILCWSRFH
ncbi:GlpM family protein, partial [Klebsiella pneumoniae]